MSSTSASCIACLEAYNCKTAWKPAASRRKEKAKAATQGSLIASAGPSLAARPPLTAAMLYEWLESQPVRQGTNPKQFEFLQLVVDRILVEAGLIQKERSVRQTGDPLVWLLHGPPGTGKSHVLGFLHQLFELVGYAYGLDYEVVAFQAVNAGTCVHLLVVYPGSIYAGWSTNASGNCWKRLL